MPEYEVEMPNPLPFARWGCHGCDADSDGTVYRAAGSTGDDVRGGAYTHMRRTGHHAYFERGTREELHPLATQPPGRRVRDDDEHSDSWERHAQRLGRRVHQQDTERRAIEQLNPHLPLQVYAEATPLDDECGSYPHGDPGTTMHQAAAAIHGFQVFGVAYSEQLAAMDRHDRTHTTAGPTPGCPWCDPEGAPDA